jgi:hypothetical protein
MNVNSLWVDLRYLYFISHMCTGREPPKDRKRRLEGAAAAASPPSSSPPSASSSSSSSISRPFCAFPVVFCAAPGAASKPPTPPAGAMDPKVHKLPSSNSKVATSSSKKASVATTKRKNGVGARKKKLSSAASEQIEGRLRPDSDIGAVAGEDADHDEEPMDTTPLEESTTPPPIDPNDSSPPPTAAEGPYDDRVAQWKCTHCYERNDILDPSTQQLIGRCKHCSLDRHPVRSNPLLLVLGGTQTDINCYRVHHMLSLVRCVMMIHYYVYYWKKLLIYHPLINVPWLDGASHKVMLWKHS